MVEHASGEIALFCNRMDNKESLHAVSVRRTCNIVKVEAGDGGRDDTAVAGENRMMNERDEKRGHVTVCGGARPEPGAALPCGLGPPPSSAPRRSTGLRAPQARRPPPRVTHPV